MSTSFYIAVILGALQIIEIILFLGRKTAVSETVVRPPDDFDEYIYQNLITKYDAALCLYHDLQNKLKEVPVEYFDTTFQECKAVEATLEMYRARIALEQKRKLKNLQFEQI